MSYNESSAQNNNPADYKATARTSNPNGRHLVAPMRRPARKFVGWKSFLRDKSYFLIAAAATSLLAWSFLAALKVRAEVIITLAFFWFSFLIIALNIEFWRKRKFYHELLAQVDHFDQAYLVLETLAEPRFYDGEVLYNVLYQINKSMAENINRYHTRSQEFQEYVEMWIHEVKTPLATLSLISRDKKINEQIRRLDDYVEQILYFVRAENAEQDYLIKSVNLADVVNNVASRNREILQAKGIDFTVQDLSQKIHTDAKWLEFILNQIINNSVKYQSSRIQIAVRTTKNNTVLTITDNGLGIATKDLPRVFDKSFTGDNGRIGKQSTGMGLYIAKTLCDKLGHKIMINSEKGKFTTVAIEFAAPEYYNVMHV